MNRRRIALLGLAGCAATALGLWAGIVAVSPPDARRLGAVIGRGDYRLQTTEGTPFTEATLKGAPSAVFFGFTHCPEVCPTTLGDIALWQQELEGEPLRVFFVTVDPERDTPDTLRDYVSWAPGVTGVSGSRAEIDKAIRAFRVYAAKVPLEDGDYTMDHSANVLLFDGAGAFFGTIGYQEPTERAVATLRRLEAAG
ncbi:SCO family protein [Pseudooceanicola sp. CBS1P-1]|uniref:SCO family protein n=1 Tax=Pseudooceanicola albus TaxID=2692189 RepID=A0A6L7FX61_9RHOB|nr:MULTISPECIES: SCO family protein [Pseudooceanicola]MBT9383409.1 SCO family protein [Pseudooceanicola endophyticus]MXN16269.1 SCO family protein [Pseudooceanicola albus]